METSELVKTNFKVVAIDQTHHWDEAIQRLAGKIETVYLVDCGFVTHCCELTPSFALTPLYYVTEESVSDNIRDIIDGELSNEDETQYYHLTFINSLKKVDVENNIEVENSECEEYREHFAEILEYVKCNHQI